MIDALRRARAALRAALSTLVLGLLWWLVVTPVAVVLRLAGRDVLRLRRRPEADTYWRERPPPAPLDRPW